MGLVSRGDDLGHGVEEGGYGKPTHMGKQFLSEEATRNHDIIPTFICAVQTPVTYVLEYKGWKNSLSFYRRPREFSNINGFTKPTGKTAETIVYNSLIYMLKEDATPKIVNIF